jgi:hypothetical protein
LFFAKNLKNTSPTVLQNWIAILVNLPNAWLRLAYMRVVFGLANMCARFSRGDPARDQDSITRFPSSLSHLMPYIARAVVLFP